MQHQSQETRCRIFQVSSCKCNLYTYYMQSNWNIQVQQHSLPLLYNYTHLRLILSLYINQYLQIITNHEIFTVGQFSEGFQKSFLHMKHLKYCINIYISFEGLLCSKERRAFKRWFWKAAYTNHRKIL